jgi:DNA-directed RNA polymerase subunit beta'
MRKALEADRTDTEAYIEDAMERLRQVWDLFQDMTPKQVVNDETLFRELKERFGSPYGWGEYFRGGMGAEAVRDLLEQVDLEAERSSSRTRSARPRARSSSAPSSA